MNNKKRGATDNKKLKAPVAKINESNRHGEIDWGSAVGKEVLPEYKPAAKAAPRGETNRWHD